jgi:hypothetical protein
MINILDRDGVLVGTCVANLAAYSQASKETGLGFDKVALEESIHKGDSIDDFRDLVWGKISDIQFARLREAKVEFFMQLLPLVQINTHWRDKILESPKDFYLATKASIESSRFIINELLPEFHDSHIYSTQHSEFPSKVDILARISKINGISSREIIFYDDSPQTIRLCMDSGFDARLTPHFCGD